MNDERQPTNRPTDQPHKSRMQRYKNNNEGMNVKTQGEGDRETERERGREGERERGRETKRGRSLRPRQPPPLFVVVVVSLRRDIFVVFTILKLSVNFIYI